MKSISIKKAVMINFISKYSNIITQMLISVILARLLTPNDYGIVAVISVFTTLFGLIANMGIGPAIIQNKELKKEEIEDIFSFTIYVSLFVAISFGIFSIPISIIYKNNIYLPIGSLLSLSIFFNALNMVPNALVSKEKKFKELGLRTIISTLGGGIIAIISAVNGFKYYSIIFSSIFSSVIIFIINFRDCKIKIKFNYDKRSINKIKKYSQFQFGFNIINYFARNLDNLLIGKFLGNIELAYYNKAYTLMLYPVQNLTHVITPVLHPILSEFQNKKILIYEKYIEIVKLLSLIGIFITIFCFFSAEEIILILFGNQWKESIVCFKILSLSIWAQMISSSSGVIFQSIGSTNLMFISGIITSIINVIGIILGIVSKSIVEISYIIMICYNLSFIITFFILIKHGFEIKLYKFFKIFLSDIIIFIIQFESMVAFNFESKSIMLSLILKLIVSIVSYFVGIIITGQLSIFKKVLSK